MQITTIGLDLAKHIFQVHGIDANEGVVEKRRLRRGQVLSYFAKLAPCRVGMEACATAHFWARELRRLGHDVLLIPLSMSRRTSSAARTMRRTRRPSARR
jgi:transposase